MVVTWHLVLIRPCFSQIDQDEAIIRDEPTDEGFRTLDLNSDLVIGAAVDYKDGYVGCMRAFVVNGIPQDLRGMVERGEVVYNLRFLIIINYYFNKWSLLYLMPKSDP